MPLGAAVPPVELVENLKGFPQIHRPGVVLAPVRGRPLVVGARQLLRGDRTASVGSMAPGF